MKKPLSTVLEEVQKMSYEQMLQLCSDLRFKILQHVATNGGHLAANLGSIELTVSLYNVFSFHENVIIWDIGHQTYAHKILTGRGESLGSMGAKDGISMFCNIFESPYDVFGAGHSSTSLSAIAGVMCSRSFSGHGGVAIAVIGDGAMSAGMFFEALNNVAAIDYPLIIVLNDNNSSIGPSAGSLNDYFGHLREKKVKITSQNCDQLDFSSCDGDSLFGVFGLQYCGVVDGHDIVAMTNIFKKLKSICLQKRSKFIVHVNTIKGFGYQLAIDDPYKFHSIGPFDVQTGQASLVNAHQETYTDLFIRVLEKIMLKDEQVVAVTAAMMSGTGLLKLENSLKDRVFDVGIAEQHQVTFAAGLAVAGNKPFVCIYSTFLQRAYDQLIHDVALQNLPVRFAIDRGGLLGKDGPTHHGVFDIAFLRIVPNMIIMCPGEALDLPRIVATAYSINNAPSAFRYPKSYVEECVVDLDLTPLEIGKSKLIKSGSRVCVMCYGCLLIGREVLVALEKFNIEISLVNALFLKPLDKQIILDLAKHHTLFVTIEEGSSGGFGDAVSSFLHQSELDVILKTFSVGDGFISQASSANHLRKELGLNSTHIVDVILSIIRDHGI